MRLRYLVGAALLLLAPATSAQLNVSITSAAKAVSGGQTRYTASGCAAGYAGANYTITLQVKDAFGVVIGTKTQLFSDPPGGIPGKWKIGFKGLNGGVTACIILADAAGDVGPTASAPLACIPPKTVPTVSAWGAVLLSAALMTIGVLLVRRRMRSATLAA
jgi:hypothetical protein